MSSLSWKGCSLVRIIKFVFIGLLFSHQAYSANYTVSSEVTGFKAVEDISGNVICGDKDNSKAYEVINCAIQQATSDMGGGIVHLEAGTYEVTDFDTIVGDGANWVSARPDVIIDNNITDELPPYQAQGLSVTKITIAADASADQAPGLIAYINFDTPIDLSSTQAMAYWFKSNKRIMKQPVYPGDENSSRFRIIFSQESNAINPVSDRHVQVWHPEPGSEIAQTTWRGHRLPSVRADGLFLNQGGKTQLNNIRSIGIELVAGDISLGDTETALYLDNMTAHYGQIRTAENVVIEGEGPYSTIIKMKDYGNMPMIYLNSPNSEIRYLQIHGNTDNATLIDYSGGIDTAWENNFSNTKIHHNFIHQTQGSSIRMQFIGLNSRIYENLLTHAENPMVSTARGANIDVAYNTLKYSTNDAFVALSSAASHDNTVRNNSFWPITNTASLSNSPDNPVSYNPPPSTYPERFNFAITRGVQVYYSAHDHIIKENKFYNMKPFKIPNEGQAIFISNGANNITIENNRLYNSNMTVIWVAPTNNLHFVNNYIEDGFFHINQGTYDEIEGNVFKGISQLSLGAASANHYGGNNYLGPDALFNDYSSGSVVTTTDVEPALKEVRAGNSWEWGVIANGGFDEGVGTNPDNWVPIGLGGNVTHTWTADLFYGVHGIKAVQTQVFGLDSQTANDHRSGWITGSYTQVFPGETITAQAIVMMESYQGLSTVTGNSGLHFTANYYKDDGSQCTVASEDIGIVASDSPWIRLKQDMVIPSGCTRMTLGFYLADANGKFTADEVKLYRKRTAKEITTSVSLDNASFENIDVAANWGSTLNSPSSALLATTDSVDGVSALKIAHAEFTQSTIKQQVYTLDPSTNYYFEFWAKKEKVLSDDDELRVQLVDIFYTGGKSWLQDDLITWGAGNDLNALSLKDTQWTRKAINFKTPPADVFSKNIEIRIINNGESGLYVDNVQLYKGFAHPGYYENTATPTELKAVVVGSGQIDLDWADVNDNDFSHYNVYRSPSPDGPFEQVATNIIDSNYSDSGLTGSTTYYYAVNVVDTASEKSVYSNTVSATTFDIVTIARASYTRKDSGFKVWATTSSAANTAVMNVEGYGVMEYSTRKQRYEFSQKNVPAPGSQITVVSEKGGSDITDVVFK